jgi:hypothetical protein
MKLLLALPLFLLLTSCAGWETDPVKNSAALDLLPGKWVMHIYLRDKEGKPRLFEDEVTIARSGDELSGTLVVPKAFTAKLENFKLNGRKFAFEIEANEGKGSFRVRYSGEFHHEDGKTFAGFGDVLAPEKELLGGFVGQKLE